MKTCSKCNVEKDFSDFRTNKTKKDGFQHYCKVCDKEAQRNWYQKNKQRLIAKAKIKNISFRENIQKYLLEILNKSSCIKCGETDILVLEFDHLHSKEFDISQSANKYKSFSEIEQEIKKCQILCANCHRKKTHEQFDTYKWKYSQVVRHDSAKV